MNLRAKHAGIVVLKVMSLPLVLFLFLVFLWWIAVVSVGLFVRKLLPRIQR